MSDTDFTPPQPTAEHAWLQRMVGEWTVEIEAAMTPGAPPSMTKGTDSVRSIGGFWVMAEGEAEMPGAGPATSLMTLGYDPQKGRFVGTFTASMMTNLWVYDGGLDASGKVLTLETEGPSMSGDGLAKYRDVIEFISDDHRTMRSRTPGEGGEWTEFMTAHYRRQR